MWYRFSCLAISSHISRFFWLSYLQVLWTVPATRPLRCCHQWTWPARRGPWWSPSHPGNEHWPNRPQARSMHSETQATIAEQRWSAGNNILHKLTMYCQDTHHSQCLLSGVGRLQTASYYIHIRCKFEARAIHSHQTLYHLAAISIQSHCISSYPISVYLVTWHSTPSRQQGQPSYLSNQMAEIR